jgi:hypothetical protein
VFLGDDPEFRDFASEDFCLQIKSKDQVGFDADNKRIYNPLVRVCEGRYVFLSRTIEDSTQNPYYPDAPGSKQFGNLVFCELDVLGFTSALMCFLVRLPMQIRELNHCSGHRRANRRTTIFPSSDFASWNVRCSYVSAG